MTNRHRTPFRAGGGWATLPGVKILTVVLALPFLLALAVGAHALLSRALKVLVWSWSPLSEREPEAATYERRVYHTATAPMMQVVAAALASGLLMWLAFVLRSQARWFALASVLALIAAIALDLRRWERVAATASHLWFQRGLGSRVHSIALDDVRDVAVEETEAAGFTLRHGRRNQLVRLTVRTAEKRLISLPKTDAHGGLDAVETVANHARMRIGHLRQAKRLQESSDEATDAARAAASAVSSRGDDLRVALQRLRQRATAPDVPAAIKPPGRA